MENVKIEMVVDLSENENINNFKPFKAHSGDAAFDLMNAGGTRTIPPLHRGLFSAGFKMELPIGYEAQIRPRSGNALKKGLTVLNTPGTIDSQYRGEVGVILYNSDPNISIEVRRGDKIAQMVIAKLPEIELSFEDVSKDSERGECGFGSTGIVGK